MPRTPGSTRPSAAARSARGMLPTGKIIATVKVPQSLLDTLFQEIEILKRQVVSQPQSVENHAVENDNARDTDPSHDATQQSLQSSRDAQRDLSVDTADEKTETSPAMSTGPWFDSMNIFKSPVLIGEAADAAFATRFRQVIADPSTPEPTHLLRLNHATNESLMSVVDVNVPWPSPSRAKFLLGAAMRYIGRCYHIVQQEAAEEAWEQISHNSSRVGTILRCRTWEMFAIGELYITKSIGINGFPGMAYFAQATKALGYLDERPEVECVELYLLLAFYSMTLNRRYSAYLFAGTATRTAIVIGLHLNVPESQLPDPRIREHRKRLFWTAFVLDRIFASRLNHPPAIQNEDIDLDLPSETPTSTPSDSFGDAEYHVANITLARLLSSIIRSVYSVRKQAEGTCADVSSRAQACLNDLQSWYEALPSRFQINDKSLDDHHELQIVSLHLRFYQHVILATRPLLLHTLRLQIAASRANPSAISPKIPPSATVLSQACIRSARHSTRLLTRAWIDGNFVTFDCFYTQSLFSSLIILAVSSLLDGIGSRQDREAYEEASRLLEQLKTAGNLVAQECSRHVEAIEGTMLAHLHIGPKAQSDDAAKHSSHGAVSQIERSVADGEVPASGMPWPEQQQPSFQELLCQPVMDFTSLEFVVGEDYLADTYWPDMSADPEEISGAPR
ncbi:fungal specific transcription factor [Diaporthe eres]|nr:fungal specific transcription factor [Diaporthe eres]